MFGDPGNSPSLRRARASPALAATGRGCLISTPGQSRGWSSTKSSRPRQVEHEVVEAEVGGRREMRGAPPTNLSQIRSAPTRIDCHTPWLHCRYKQ